MKIRKAIKLARDGTKIHRPCWGRQSYCLVMDGRIRFYNHKNEFVSDWDLWAGDILAEDWEVVQ